MRLVFDLETNGLLDKVTTVHCMAVMDPDSGQEWAFRPDQISDGLALLSQADVLYAHNGLKFDYPVLEKLYGWKPKGVRRDTIVFARLVYPDLKDSDYVRARNKTLPTKLIGSHSLEAWGRRLGEFKGEYTGGWEKFSDEMLDYNVQDVRVTVALLKKLEGAGFSEESVNLEHEFQEVILLQEERGLGFNVKAASDLYLTLVKRRMEIDSVLKDRFGSWWETEGEFVPKVNNRKAGYIKGQAVTKVTKVEFNPGSRHHIANRLTALYGWTPEVFTETGQPQIDETVLSKLAYPEAPMLAERFLIEKRIGQIAEGKEAWLKAEKQGRIHGRVTTNGAVTGRCTHSRPNLAQVPRVGSPYGSECRSLFVPSPGFVLVGADLAGLELRCLAHFMARYDDGSYAETVVNGDVHTLNQQAAGLETRNQAKTFIYAFLYGAGDAKIGSIVEPEADEATQKKIGKALKSRFLKQTPALRDLRKAVVEAAERRGYLKGIDGRKLRIRSSHAALNTLLQNAGAVIAKRSSVLLYQQLSTDGLLWGKDWAQVAHVHDEVQIEVRDGDDLPVHVGTTAVKAMQGAGLYYNFRCPITGEFKVGRTWAETH